MSVSVSIYGLIKAGAEQLIPSDVMDHVRACEVAGEDAAPLWVFADRLAEIGEPELEDAVRYMAKRARRPRHMTRSRPRDGIGGSTGLRWEWSLPVIGDKDSWMLADHLCSMESRRHDGAAFDGPTWLSAVAWLGGQLSILRADLDVSAPTFAEEPAP